jgi:hypothetical protein
MTWTHILYAGACGHIVPTELVPQLKADLRVRGVDTGAKDFPDKVIDKAALDLPGMVMADRRWANIACGAPELVLSFPYSDFEYFLEKLQGLPLRHFADGSPYYKLHGWMNAIVLTPELRRTVLAYMLANLDAVRTSATAEDQEFERRLAGVNADKVRVLRAKVVKNKPIPQGTMMSGRPSRERN